MEIITIKTYFNIKKNKKTMNKKRHILYLLGKYGDNNCRKLTELYYENFSDKVDDKRKYKK